MSTLPIVAMTQGESVGTWNVFRYRRGVGEQSDLGVSSEELPTDARDWLANQVRRHHA